MASAATVSWGAEGAGFYVSHEMPEGFFRPYAKVTHKEGVPRTAIELVPGSYIVVALQAGRRRQTRGVTMRSGHDQKLVLGPDAPIVLTVDVRGRPSEELSLAVFAADAALALGPLDAGQVAQLDPENLLEAIAIEPSADGLYRGELEVAVGRWAVLVEAPSRRVAGTVLEIRGPAEPAHVDLEIQ